MDGSRVESALHDAVSGSLLSAYVAPERAVRLAEFGAVGATGAAVNLLVLLALAGGDGLLLPGLIAFAVGVAWTYGLNHALTFDPSGTVLERVPHYAAVYVIGYVIYTAFLSVGVGLTLPYWLSGLTATGAGGLWNYWGTEQFALD